MKRIWVLDGPTPGLADYLEGDGHQANWDGFGSHHGGAAKRELTESLCSIQHGLCGYCEIDCLILYYLKLLVMMEMKLD